MADDGGRALEEYAAMLLKRATLDAIVEGRVSVVFRRWKSARVRPGTKLRTAVGLVEVTGVDETRAEDIKARTARAAGYASTKALLDELDRYPDGKLYQIGVRFEGGDPRIELREKKAISAEELAELESKLARLGARTAEGPWALTYLQLIAKHPARRAPDLASQLSLETKRFKARVRQLKELGLTESLAVGYRLSPRGRALLRHLR